MNARVEPPPTENRMLPAQLESADKLISQAIAKNLPIESMEKLFAMREKLMAEAAKGAFFDALSKFQAECPVIKKRKTATVRIKDRTTGQDSGREYTYNYAPLDHIVKVVAPKLTAHSLSYRIEAKLEEKKDGVYVEAECIVHHVAGHSESSTFSAPIDKTARMNDMQKHASALMYAKRYAFCNALGILTGDEDDDGQKGGAAEGKRAEKQDGAQSYPDASFNKALPSWKTLIESKKKTVADIVAMIGSKYVLSEAQLQKLNAAGGSNT